MKIVFMGTPEFALPTLKGLIECGHEIPMVVTQPDRAGNRGKLVASPVKTYSLEQGIRVEQPERIRKSPELIGEIAALEPDMIVVVAFGQILPKEVLDIPKFGSINVHGSLLPKFRGASPMQYAILSGEEKTGITIMRMDEGMDTGDMIAKSETEIGNKDIIELADELSKLGAELLLDTIPAIENGTAIYEKQLDEEASYTKMIKKTDGRTDFNEDAAELERKMRAYKDWPTLHSYLKGQMIKIYGAEVAANAVNFGEAGTVAEVNDNNFIVNCTDSQLIIKELQLQGKKRMPAADFLRGYRLKPGDRFSLEADI